MKSCIDALGIIPELCFSEPDASKIAQYILHNYPRPFRDLLCDICKDASKCSRVGLAVVSHGDHLDSLFYKGVAIHNKSFARKDMASGVQDARVLVFSCPLEFSLPKTGTEWTLTSVAQVRQVKAEIEEFYQNILKTLVALNVNVVVCQWRIDEYLSALFAKAGISAIPWVTGKDIERISIVCSTFICSHWKVVGPELVGRCDSVHLVENTGLIVFRKESCSFGHIILCTSSGGGEELRRSVQDAIGVLRCMKNDMCVWGGGTFERQLAARLEALGHTFLPEALRDLAGLLEDQKARDENAVVPAQIKIGVIEKTTDLLMLCLKMDGILYSGSDAYIFVFYWDPHSSSKYWNVE
eukprot:ANDGO_05562.mRNA.1 T-complex protein 1 subunit epsilon